MRVAHVPLLPSPLEFPTVRTWSSFVARVLPAIPGGSKRRALVVLLVLGLPLGVPAKAAAASTYGYYAQVYLTTAYNYDTIAYNNAPVGSNGMMHQVANMTCLQCHASLANAPAGNSYSFEAYLFSYYASQYATMAYNADVNGDAATAKTYYTYAYLYGYYAYVYAYTSYTGQFLNSSASADAYYGYLYGYYGYIYAYYASQGL
jgi:hypothetical protein